MNAAITAAGATGADASLARSGWYIQQAIWYLEQERSQAQIHPVAYQLALGADANAWLAKEAAGARIYAMNLTLPDGTLRQDQLVLVPELGVLAHLYAGLGLLGAGASWLRRRTAIKPRT
jgi:hypothetical protein